MNKFLLKPLAIMLSLASYSPTILLSLTSLPSFAVTSSQPQPVTLTIKNPLPSARTTGEMVELDASRLPDGFLLVTTERGDTLPCQRTYNGKVIFPCPRMEAKQTIKVKLAAFPADDASAASATKSQPKVFGRLYPERQSDFSFENDRIAFRIYGPETQRKGERLYGYDIFLKRSAALVLDHLYASQCNREMWNTVGQLRRLGHRELAEDVYQYGFCYHVDHGEGMDIYKVGQTLGAGTNALISPDGQIAYPWCFSKAEVLDDGPLRLTVRLTFATTTVAGTEVSEVRTLSIDAGSQMVRTVVEYSPTLPSGYSPMAAIAVHKENPTAYLIDKERGIIACDDLGDPDIYRKKDRAKFDPQKGHTFIGCLMPGATDCRFVSFEKETSGAVGHVIAMAPKDNTMTYYFGYAWDGNPLSGIASVEQWQEYLRMFSEQLRQPLKVNRK